MRKKVWGWAERLTKSADNATIWHSFGSLVRDYGAVAATVVTAAWGFLADWGPLILVLALVAGVAVQNLTAKKNNSSEPAVVGKPQELSTAPSKPYLSGVEIVANKPEQGEAAADVDDTQYALDKIRALCLSALDPASEALAKLHDSLYSDLEWRNPGINVASKSYGKTLRLILAEPKQRMASFLATARTDRNSIDEKEAAQILKSYFDGYVWTARLAKEASNLRELVKRDDYEAWKAKHRHLKQVYVGFERDPWLREVRSRLGCVGLSDQHD